MTEGRRNRTCSGLLKVLGVGSLIVLALGFGMYWDFVVADVAIDNRSDVPLLNVRLDLGGTLLFNGTVWPHQSRTFHGRPKEEEIAVSLDMDGHHIRHKEYDSSTGSLFVIDVNSPSDIGYNSCPKSGIIAAALDYFTPPDTDFHTYDCRIRGTVIQSLRRSAGGLHAFLSKEAGWFGRGDLYHVYLRRDMDGSLSRLADFEGADRAPLLRWDAGGQMTVDANCGVIRDIMTGEKDFETESGKARVTIAVNIHGPC